MSDARIFDRRAVRLHRDRAAAGVAAVDDLLREVADRLLDRLDDTTRRFAAALDVGGRGVVAPVLRARGRGGGGCDLSPRMAARNGGPAVAADEEMLPFAPESFDLVVANLSLHWVNDLPGCLVQLRRALRPDGLFLASLPALGTLDALRSGLTEAELDLCGGASPRVSPFAELRDCAALLQRAGFAMPTRWRCCASCAPPARPTPCCCATGASRRAPCSRPRWPRCRSATAASRRGCGSRC